MRQEKELDDLQLELQAIATDKGKLEEENKVREKETKRLAEEAQRLAKEKQKGEEANKNLADQMKKMESEKKRLEEIAKKALKDLALAKKETDEQRAKVAELNDVVANYDARSKSGDSNSVGRRKIGLKGWLEGDGRS